MSIGHLYSAIESSEGFRAVPYKDSLGLWSCGIGLCLERNPLTINQWKTLLDAGLIEVKLNYKGARLLMVEKLNVITLTLRDTIPDWYQIDEPRRHVLTEMGYQLGTGFIYTFKKMMAAVYVRDWETAAKEGLDSLWAKQTPKRAHLLMDNLRTGAW